MNSYALKECDSCYVQLPANAMHAHTRNRETGSSQSSYSGSSARRTTTHFRREDYFLCPPCHDARRRAQLILVALAVVGGLVLYVVGALNEPTQSPAPQVEAVAEPTNLLEGIDLQSVDTVSPDPIEIAEPAAETEVETGSEAEQPMPLPDSGATGDGGTQAALDGLEADIQAALSSGAARQWYRGGQTGYVVPSELQAGVNAQCRSFAVTLIEDQSQSQIGSGERCLNEPSERWLTR